MIHPVEEERMAGKFLGRTVWACACALVMLVVGARMAAAASVVVAPSDTTVSVGDDLYVRVEADAFPDLKGYELIFQYDPTIVQLLGALPGDVLTGDGDPFFATLVPDVSAPADSAWFDAAMLTGSTQGPGVLVYYHFKALAVGVSPLDCRRVDYRDSNNVQTLPSCTGGVIRVVGVTPAKRETWGGMKALYR
jgi:hypothetical protein